MNISTSLLVAAVGCTQERADQFAGPLTEVCVAYEINTPARVAAFLAQLAHESNALKSLVESLNYSSARLVPTFGAHRITQEQADGYGRSKAHPADQEAIANIVYGGAWGAKNLGNTQPGDGWLFRGRGPIQLTGRANYARFRDRLRARLGAQVPDFEAIPEKISEPYWGAYSAGDYWDVRGLNKLADVGNFEAIVRKVNGGLIGIEDRKKRFEIARAAVARFGLGATIQTEVATESEVATMPIRYMPAGEGSPQEPEMAPLIPVLGSALIEMFAPLAREKIQKEISRHTDNPEIASQVANAAIETAKALTGKSDAIDAVAEVRKDPALVEEVQQSALDELAKMAPMLDKMAEWDKQAWAAAEASMAAASERASGDPDDQDPYLTRSIVTMTAGILIGGAVLTGVLAWMKVDVQVILGALLALVGAVGGKFQTRYDHRYGSSRGSSAKDVVISTLSKK